MACTASTRAMKLGPARPSSGATGVPGDMVISDMSRYIRGVEPRAPANHFPTPAPPRRSIYLHLGRPLAPSAPSSARLLLSSTPPRLFSVPGMPQLLTACRVNGSRLCCNSPVATPRTNTTGIHALVRTSSFIWVSCCVCHALTRRTTLNLGDGAPGSQSTHGIAHRRSVFAVVSHCGKIRILPGTAFAMVSLSVALLQPSTIFSIWRSGLQFHDALSQPSASTHYPSDRSGLPISAAL